MSSDGSNEGAAEKVAVVGVSLTSFVLDGTEELMGCTDGTPNGVSSVGIELGVPLVDPDCKKEGSMLGVWLCLLLLSVGWTDGKEETEAEGFALELGKSLFN